MAGHLNEVRIVAQVGNETEGILISGEMREKLFPGMTDTQIAEGIAQFLTDNVMLKRKQTATAGIDEQIAEEIAQYISPIS